MLAYVFWHHPAEPAGYEERLAAFVHALAAHPPPGFRAAASFAVDGEPWAPGAPAYVDWYLVADWAALGTLNEAAVLGPRRAAHDAAARAAAGGTAAVYRLRHGAAELDGVRGAAWLSKPADVPYEAFEAGLRIPAASLWQRQLTLGPAREFVLLGAADAPVAAEVRSRLRRVA